MPFQILFSNNCTFYSGDPRNYYLLKLDIYVYTANGRINHSLAETSAIVPHFGGVTASRHLTPHSSIGVIQTTHQNQSFTGGLPTSASFLGHDIYFQFAGLFLYELQLL